MNRKKICSIILSIVALALFVVAFVMKKKNGYNPEAADYTVVLLGLVVSALSVIFLLTKNKTLVLVNFIATLGLSILLFKIYNAFLNSVNWAIILNYSVLDVTAILLFIVSAVFALSKDQKWAKITLVSVASYLFVKGIVAFAYLVCENKFKLIMSSYYALGVIALMVSVFVYAALLLTTNDSCNCDCKKEDPEEKTETQEEVNE